MNSYDICHSSKNINEINHHQNHSSSLGKNALKISIHKGNNGNNPRKYLFCVPCIISIPTGVKLK